MPKTDTFSKNTYFYVTSLISRVLDSNILIRTHYLRIKSTVIVFSAIVVVYRYLYGVVVRGSVLGTFP